MTTIIEYNGTQIVEEEVVLTVEETGASGIDGTFPALDDLDEKSIVTASDLALSGDSADSFTNKKSTWQQVIDSVLSVFILKTDLNNVTNDAQLKRSAGDYQAFTQKISPALGDSVLAEDSADGWNKKWMTLEGIKDLFLAVYALIFQPISSVLDIGTITTDFTLNATDDSDYLADGSTSVTITLGGFTASRSSVLLKFTPSALLTLSLASGPTYNPMKSQTLDDLASGVLHHIVFVSLDLGANIDYYVTPKP